MAKKKSSVVKLIEKLPTGGEPTDLMGQLLARAKTQLRGLIAGQSVEGTVINIGNKSLSLDIGAKSEGLVTDLEFQSATPFIKTLKVGDKVQATVIVPETVSGQSLLSVRSAAEDAGWKYLEEAERETREVDATVLVQTRGGLTVNAAGLEGFVPMSQVGSELAKKQNLVGRTIKVKVREVNREENRVVLSERAVSESDLIAKQQKAVQNIEKGEVFDGEIVGVVNFGVFVQFEKNGIPLEGLVHLSEISWQKVSDPTTVFEVGKSVKVIVIGKEPDRLALSIKQTVKDPWGEIAQKYAPETKVKGKVTRVGDAGAYVELEPGMEGLIRHGKIPADMSVKVGDKLDVFVEGVEAKNHKISLGVVLKAKPVGYK